jgi:hypothetical protein
MKETRIVEARADTVQPANRACFSCMTKRSVALMEKIVERVAGIEKALGICELAQFTPRG